MLRPSLESSALLARGGKPTVRELLQSLVFNLSDGTIRLHGDRLVIQRAAVNHEMRRELTRILGRDEARVFLIRLGFLSGQADARFIRSAWPNLSIGDAFTAGPRLHTFSGVVRVETVHNDFDFLAVHYITDTKTLAHPLKYDSTLRHLDADISATEGGISVNGDAFKVFSERDPSKIDWESVWAEGVGAFG